MANVTVTIENNFSAGLKTEFTGLNFPPHAATDTDNCIYDLTGDVTRREGFDFEDNFVVANINRTGNAISTYKWNNVGGDGLTQIVVSQIGDTLKFYRSSQATSASPLSTQLLLSYIDLSAFRVNTGADSSDTECQYTDGNGYLLIFHPDLNPIYCKYDAGTLAVQATAISVQIRDFLGIPENIPDEFRPNDLSNEHLYNLRNQGWGSAPNWTANSVTVNDSNTGVHTWTVQTGLTISAGQSVSIQGRFIVTGFPVGITYESGLVTAYNSGTGSLSINVNSSSQFGSGIGWNQWAFYSNTQDHLTNWHTAIGNYPSNSDVWWRFKDSTGAFNPTATINNVTLSTGPAPKGSYILPAFAQDRSAISSVAGLTPVTTNVRPKTGTWFQGRVWYAGVDASQQATGDAPYYSWTESIYFSQIVVSEKDFGKCYQTNDPTDENLFDLLPSDGGVIQIQGCGSVYKLFPIQNGMLIFAANGIWFVTGSQGIGFTASDYTITKISQIQSISGNSFINVQGLPYFWNEEGIYTVVPAQQGLGLNVEPLTVGSILSFYNDIPLQSKKFVKGDYNPIDYVIQWCYRSTNESNTTDRYNFNRILCFNTYNKAFYPYTLANTPSGTFIHSINYVSSPGGSSAAPSMFKYLCSIPSSGTYFVTFADEHDDGFRDWRSDGSGGSNFESYFVTGYRLAGQGLKSFQPSYIYMFSRTNGEASGYKIQGIWDYANDRSSGKYSGIQRIINGLTRFGMVYRKHRIRGHGLALQLKVISVDGLPFDIMGWTAWETQNASI